MTGIHASGYRPIRTPRVYEEVCAQIRHLVAVGELKPGDRLPTERELAELLKVSRMAVREALRSLEIAGMIRLRSGSKGGAFIREDNAGTLVQPMQDMLDLGHISLEELTEVRLMVLDVATRLAVERASDAELDALDANVDETERLTREGKYAERTWVALEFYFLLMRATRNKAMYAIAEPIIEILRRIIEQAGPGPDTRLVASRRKLVKALRARDAEKAATEMRTYLHRIHRHLMQWQARADQTTAMEKNP
jgi:DNA-binding FadR family transcriptional regulator